MLPMGWSNSVPISHNHVTFIPQTEVPDFTQLYIDDVPMCGGDLCYELPGGGHETIAKNLGIRAVLFGSTSSS